MSFLTIEQYLDDADCPELCNNANFTIIRPKDVNDYTPEEYSTYLAYNEIS